jgi:UDP-N-acetylmuramate dehydrogenase
MTIADIAQSLRGTLKGTVSVNERLARFTTYRLGGPAALYLEPADETDIMSMARVLSTASSVDMLVIGRGSNLVISDAGWPGMVVRLGAGFSYVVAHPQGLKAGGATPLGLLANWAARRGLAGIEFTIAIPGSVGGAIRMNAGAHGREIKDSLGSASVYDVTDARLEERGPEDLDLSYRHSNVGDDDLVLSAVFHLAEEGAEPVKQRMEAYRKHRAETQPGAVQNAGSVFRNPPGDHAGRLVEATGLKGFRIGGARVSELHANFFIATDGATAQDVYDLVGEVRRRVLEAQGIDLVPEIRFVGAFEEHAGRMESR